MRMMSRTMEPGWRTLAASATSDLWMGCVVVVAHVPTIIRIVGRGSNFDEPQPAAQGTPTHTPHTPLPPTATEGRRRGAWGAPMTGDATLATLMTSAHDAINVTPTTPRSGKP